jgi:hypothetical protein
LELLVENIKITLYEEGKLILKNCFPFLHEVSLHFTCVQSVFVSRAVVSWKAGPQEEVTGSFHRRGRNAYFDISDFY